MQTQKFTPIATELAENNFTTTSSLEIEALQEHLLQEGDAKLARSKHPFPHPLGVQENSP